MPSLQFRLDTMFVAIAVLCFALAYPLVALAIAAFLTWFIGLAACVWILVRCLALSFHAATGLARRLGARNDPQGKESPPAALSLGAAHHRAPGGNRHTTRLASDKRR